MNRFALEAELKNLYKEITTYDNGIFRNMNLTDEKFAKLFKETFSRHEDLVVEYVNLIYDLQKKGDIGTDYPLPPFIVFAFYSPVTIGWRMGAGEGYEEVWCQIINSLSKEELIRYCSQYEYPEWWKNYWMEQGVDLPSRYQSLPWSNLS